MRGCLTILILAAIFVVAGTWFGGPPLASALVTGGLQSAGLDAAKLDVRVEANPPLRLALGQADRVEVDGTGVEWNGLRARTLDLTLADVDFLARTVRSTHGRLAGVELPKVDPPGSEATLEIDGPGDGATATITIDAATVEAMALAAFERELGVRPDSATLVAPNVVRVKARGATLDGRLAVQPDGSVAVSTPIGTATIVESDRSQPIRLTDVAVEDGGLVLTGTIDVEGLLRG